MKQLFHISGVLKAEKLHQAMTSLEALGVMNLEIKTILPPTPVSRELKGLTPEEKRQEVLAIIPEGTWLSGTKIQKSVSFSMQNPTGFLRRMVKLGMIKQNKITKEYTV